MCIHDQNCVVSTNYNCVKHVTHMGLGEKIASHYGLVSFPDSIARGWALILGMRLAGHVYMALHGRMAVVQCSLAVSSFFATTILLLWNKDIARELLFV